MSYQVRLIRRLASLHHLEESWNELLLASSGSTVFASFQWSVVWWRYFGAGDALHVLTVWKDGRRLIAVAPMMVRRFGPVRKLQFLGTGLSDYGDMLVHPDFAHDAISAIFEYLRAHHRSWDLGDWSEVPAHSLMLSFLRAHKPRGLRTSLIPQTPCPVIDLPSTWEAYTGSLERKRRYYVSSYPRKFMREQSGSIEVLSSLSEPPALSEDNGEATYLGGGKGQEENTPEEAVAVFHRLHLSRWADKSGSISREHIEPGFEPFLRDVCVSFAKQGWLRIVSLRAGDQVVASSLNFLMHGRWSAYMKGFDPDWSNSRPGTVLDAQRIQEAIDEGARQFDFGRGDEAYKSGYGGRTERNTRILLATRTPRSVAAYALLLMRRRVDSG